MKTLIILLVLFPLIASAKFTHESEIGYIQSSGNAEINTTNAKTANIYNWDKYATTFGGHYTYGESGTSVTIRNWDANAKIEQAVSEHLSLIAGEVVEGNLYIAIRARYNSDIGVKYYFTKADIEYFFTEVSYRYAIEDRYTPYPDTIDHKARLYNEYERKASETVQYKFWLEYVPNFTQGSDYLVNGEASITSILNSVFSMKFAYKGMYDNLPADPAFKTYDSLVTTSLVAKF
jgi:putative salt-induced outer membrane protein